MNTVNYVFIVIFSLFMLSSKTRATASVLLSFYFIYYEFALQFHGLERYAAIGTIEALAGCYLIYGSKHMLFNHKDNSIAETYFILVFINVAGGALYENYYPPVYYDNMCITLMGIQIIILSWRAIRDGWIVNRCSLLHPLLGTIIDGINQRHSLLQGRKKKSQEVKRVE
jgi:peptidoglycan/LPS O-acetylase OafA/YrhL